MMAYAIDHPAPGTIVLISGDRDFAYAISTLRLRRYRVIVVAPPQTHLSLLSLASLAYAWNGGKADLILPLHHDMGSESDYSFDRGRRQPMSASMSGSPSNKDALRCMGHETSFTRSHTTRALNEDPGQHMVQEHVAGRLVDTSASLLGGKSSLSEGRHVLKGESPNGMASLPAYLPLDPSSTVSGLNGPQGMDSQPTLTYTALASIPHTDTAAFPARTPVVKQPIAKFPTDSLEPQDSPPTGSSVFSGSFRLVGEYPRRVIRNMSRHDGVVVWRRRLQRSAGNVNDEPCVSNPSTGECGELDPNDRRSSNRHGVWDKCRVTLVSLLAFKQGTSIVSVASGAKSANSTAPPSSSPSFATVPAPSTMAHSTVLPLIASPTEQADGAKNESAVFPSPKTSAAVCLGPDNSPVEPPCADEDLFDTPAQSAAVVFTASDSVTELPSPAPLAKGGVDSSAIVLPAFTCLPLSKTGSAHVQCAIVKDELSPDACLSICDFVGDNSAPGSQAATLPCAASTSKLQNAMIVSNSSFPNLPVTQSSINPTVFASSSRFVVLVEELQSLYRQGLSCPRRSIVADGLTRRDPLVYERAGITNKTKFNTYIDLAVQAGVVTVGGRKKKWIVLNAASPIISGSTPSPVTNTHAIAQVPSSVSNVLESLPEVSSAPAQNALHDFGLLVQRLQRLQVNKVPQPFRSLVAIDLVLQDRAVYQKVGVNDFDAYAALAVKAGLVELGGEGPRAWISLKA